jgi:hypothetical protein
MISAVGNDQVAFGKEGSGKASRKSKGERWWPEIEQPDAQTRLLDIRYCIERAVDSEFDDTGLGDRVVQHIEDDL